MSPISLLELGLYARSRKLVVYCPKKYWRHGNVEVVCHNYRVPMMMNMDAFIAVAIYGLVETEGGRRLGMPAEGGEWGLRKGGGP